LKARTDSDTAEALDEGSMAALIMPDLSAGYSMTNNSILLKPFEFSFGIDLSKDLPHQQNSVCFSLG